MTGRIQMLDGSGLSIADLAAIAGNEVSVEIAPAGLTAMRETNNILLKFAKERKPVYGVTTGLGPRVKQALSLEEIEAFALKTIRGRAHAIGRIMSKRLVRAAMAIRLNSLLTGASGASPRIAEHLARCLNADLVPEVGETASIGASDLLWGGSMALALIGEGRFLGSKLENSAADLKAAGIEALTLGPRDGLALVSHSSFSAAFAALGLQDTGNLMSAAQTAAALTLEGFRGNLSPFNPSLLSLRPQPGQSEAAADLLNRLEGSRLWEMDAARRLQDPLSIRNIAQVNGAAFAAMKTVEETLNGEMNGATDNPVVLAKTGEVLSGGSYLNPYLAVSLVGLNQALVHLAAGISARTAKLLSARFTDLPNGLISENADAAGFAPVAKLSEALFAEISHLAAPPVVFPSQLGDGVEDTLTNAAISAKALQKIARRLARLIAFEMIAAAQAIRLRVLSAEEIGVPLRPILQKIEEISPPLSDDRPMAAEIEALAELILKGEFK